MKKYFTAVLFSILAALALSFGAPAFATDYAAGGYGAIGLNGSVATQNTQGTSYSSVVSSGGSSAQTALNANGYATQQAQSNGGGYAIGKVNADGSTYTNMNSQANSTSYGYVSGNGTGSAGAGVGTDTNASAYASTQNSYQSVSYKIDGYAVAGYGYSH